MKSMHRVIALALTLCLAMGLCTTAFAAVSDDALSVAVTDTAEYMYRTVQSPQVGSIGGEWAVIGLARSGYAVPQSYWDSYYKTVEDYVKACKGVLHEKKYTEYSRVIVALSSIGADARNVAGYDLTKPLGDYDKTIWQGMNGPIWALIALDSRDYPMPVNAEAKTQATRQMYIDRILDCQLDDGGWSLSGGAAAASGAGVSDPDITGMALQALAKYQDQEKVKTATDKALTCLSKMQDKDGGYASWGSTNSESVVQVIVGLTELGIPLDDARFVKNGKTLEENLLSFRQNDGSFLHTADGSGSNLMASEQGLYVLAAIWRAQQGKSSLYRMNDVTIHVSGANAAGAVGLPDKHADVKRQTVTAPGTTFDDISAHVNQPAIEALASRGIINGKGSGEFDPDAAMTRAEFATITVNALGLTPKSNNSFTDVKSTDWFAPYVGAASRYGIITGRGGGKFDPNGAINRQEAALMVARAAKLCGMDTELSAAAVRDTLAQFSDYVKTDEWARQGLAFCYAQKILDDGVLEIRGTEVIRRCEIAQMLFNLLGSAKLL